MTTNDDARDSGRLFIAALLGIFLTFFALMLLGSALGMANATTLGWWALSFVGFCGNLWMLSVGFRLTARFVTGRDCEVK